MKQVARRLGASLAFAGVLAAASASAGEKGLYSLPDIHGDTIVFCAEGDLFTVSTSGGLATRLTTGDGPEQFPNYSPDGKTIAFTGVYGGNNDVYTIAADGGQVTRLTYHPYTDRVTGWMPDGSAITYMTARNGENFQQYTYTVPAAGGAPTMLPLGQASWVSVNPDGKRVVFNRLLTTYATWKRYLGGTQDDIWTGEIGGTSFHKLTTYPGQDSQPKWVGDRIVFVSERDGRRNIWSLDQNGNDLKQHTHFTDFDARNPNTDGGSQVVYEHGGDIRLLNIATGEDKLVDIDIPTERKYRRPHSPPAAQRLEGFALSHDGERVAVVSRGEVLNYPASTGRTVNLTQTSGAREKNAVFVGRESESVLFWSDRSGEEELYMRDARGEKEAVCLTKGKEGKHGGWHFPPEPSPDGKKVAWADQKGTLYWMDLQEKEIHEVDDSNVWELREYEWSPDSRYLAYAKYVPSQRRVLMIYDSVEHQTRAITTDFTDSYSPTWDPEGKYLFYLADRTVDPLLGSQDFEAVLAPMTKIYMTLLSKDSENPFFETDSYEMDDLEKAGADPYGVADEEMEKDEDPKHSYKRARRESRKAMHEGKGPKKVDVKIDWDGLDRRQIVIDSVEVGQLFGLVAAKERLFYSRSTFGGMFGEFQASLMEDDPVLYALDYTEKDAEPSPFASNVRSYAFTPDRQFMAVSSRGGIYVTDAHARGLSPDNADRVPLEDGRIQINPEEEWAQIIEEAYRLYRDFFYTPDMAGVDWRAEADKYKALLPRLSTRADLSTVLGDLIGEMGHGHTYVMGSGVDGMPWKTSPTGMLAADFDVDTKNDAFRFKKIFRGESWNPEMQAPLGQPNINIKEGEYLLAVNGERVSAKKDPDSYFWGLAGTDVLLTVNSAPSMEGSRTVRVKLAYDEGNLRYYEWVENNRAYVDRVSGGEFAYIHLPDMSEPGMREFFRQWFPQLHKKGLIVDVRFNGGGFVSQLVIHRLRRVLYAWGNVRNFDDGTYPSAVFNGPMVLITNESAGSDGDIISESFRLFDLGPIVGTRSWGGVVGIRSDKPFVDGGLITIPEFGWWEGKRGWTLENSGVTPDYEVENTPEDQLAGRDAQLDKALDVLRERMKTNPGIHWEKPLVPGNGLARFRERSAEWMTKP